jgi:hypothetical protein
MTGSFGMAHIADVAPLGSSATSISTKPNGTSRTMRLSGAPVCILWRWAKTTAVPIMGWPAKGSSRAGVKMRTKAV